MNLKGDRGCAAVPKRSKPKVAFVCVHNACRSQIAECLGKLYAEDVFESYSAGTAVKDRIDADAIRIMKKLYGVDMQKTQYCKQISEIPPPDAVILMGCNVECPAILSEYTENWGIADPTGKSDEVFVTVIGQIRDKILQLKDKLR